MDHLTEQPRLAKTPLIFTREPYRQPGVWCIFEQLVSATLLEKGSVQIMTGAKNRLGTHPRAELSDEQRKDHARQVEEYNLLNGTVYSILLIAIANGPGGHAGPAVSPVPVFEPVPSCPYGGGREVLALTERYGGPRSFKAFDIHERLRAVAMAPADRKDPARVLEKMCQIGMGLEAANQAVASSLLANTPHRALLNK